MGAFRRFILWILIPNGFQLEQSPKEEVKLLELKKGPDGVYS